MSTPRNRQPSGVPTGGQFATSERATSGIGLGTGDAACRRVEQQRAEDGMDEIAAMLGEDEEWDGSANYLEDIANVVGESGRPHPGDRDPDEYRAVFDDYTADRTGAGTVTEHQLDGIALGLGTKPEWGAEELEWIALAVEDSGRPSPGGTVSGDEYLGMLDQVREERAATAAGSPATPHTSGA